MIDMRFYTCPIITKRRDHISQHVLECFKISRRNEAIVEVTDIWAVDGGGFSFVP